MKIPSHYSLAKEHPDSYEIHDDRDDRRFHIAKKGLNLEMHGKLSKIKKFAEGTPDGTVGDSAEPYYDKEDMAPDQREPNRSPAEVITPESLPDPMAPSQTGGSSATWAPVAPANTQDARVPSSIPESKIAPTPVAPDPFAKQSMSGASSLAGEKNALLAGAKAEGAEGAQTAKAYADYAAKLDASLTPQQLLQNHKAADDLLMQKYQAKEIDPDHYWKTQSTGQKIGASLGMIFGGIGSAKTGSPNYAMQTIQNNINNDIEAQKNSQGKAMNLWKMNREATQDDMQANLATQNQLLTGVKAKALQYAAQAQGPEARARIAPVLAQIDQQMASNNLHRALLSGNQSGGFLDADPSQLVQSMVPPDHQKAVYEEIGRAQNVSRNSNSILSKFDQASKDNTVLQTGAGMIRTPGSVMALHQLLLPNFKQIDGTVRQAAMDETFHNVTPAPGDTAEKIAQKRDALIQWMHSETVAPIAKGSGLDLQRFSSTSADPTARLAPQQRQWVNWARANPSDPRSAVVLKKLGVQ